VAYCAQNFPDLRGDAAQLWRARASNAKDSGIPVLEKETWQLLLDLEGEKRVGSFCTAFFCHIDGCFGFGFPRQQGGLCVWGC